MFIAVLLLAGCALTAPAAEERIIEVHTQRSITRAELIDVLRASDYVLLGEQHDNPEHHKKRGELLQALRAPATVVAEHLTRGQKVKFDAELSAKDSSANALSQEGIAHLRKNLLGAGFDEQGWRWPVHAPLFAATAQAQLPLTGGNLPRTQARAIALEGTAALPQDIAQVLALAPLSEPAQAALNTDLIHGHCGHLKEPALSRMRLAQRARDASMWMALSESKGAPAILLAGNGHVRLDYGVPQLIRHPQSSAQVVSVGFIEVGTALETSLKDAPYTYVWLTPGVKRPDPCAGFSMRGR